MSTSIGKLTKILSSSVDLTVCLVVGEPDESVLLHLLPYNSLLVIIPCV